jgi:alginate O-acetyltransferase complex protein AlgJ
MSNISGNRVSAYILIFLLVCGGPLLVLFFKSKQYAQATLWPHAKYGFLTGEPTSKFDKIYKEAFLTKEFSVTLLNTISYVAFHESRKGAIIGRNGWIFSDEEFVWQSTSQARVDAHIKQIFDIEATLEAQGTRLVVVLVPQKASVYQEYLGSVQMPLEQQQLYHDVRQNLLTHSKIMLPDIKAALENGKPGQEMFLRTDTHWTVSGAGAAAVAVAKSIPKELLGEIQKFKSVAATPTTHNGDLLKFVDLGRWSNLLPVQTEAITSLKTFNVEATVDEFLAEPSDAKKNQEIVLVGTSYSANSLWSFQSQLELAVGVSLMNWAKEGAGYVAPMKSFLESNKDQLKNVRLVIWEIPVRYLVVDNMKSE